MLAKYGGGIRRPRLVPELVGVQLLLARVGLRRPSAVRNWNWIRTIWIKCSSLWRSRKQRLSFETAGNYTLAEWTADDVEREKYVYAGCTNQDKAGQSEVPQTLSLSA